MKKSTSKAELVCWLNVSRYEEIREDSIIKRLRRFPRNTWLIDWSRLFGMDKADAPCHMFGRQLVHKIVDELLEG